MLVAYNQIEKGLLLITYVWNISKEQLTRSVWVTGPAHYAYVSHMRQVDQDIWGHEMTLVTRRTALCDYYTHLKKR